jgi:hypothetical protein
MPMSPTLDGQAHPLPVDRPILPDRPIGETPVHADMVRAALSLTESTGQRI